MFKIIDKYVFKECALGTIGVIAVLLLILLGNMFARVLGDIAKGELPAETLWTMLLVYLVHYLIVVLPLGLYLGILLGMGRLYRDSEMSAMFACGIGASGLYRPIIALTVPVTLLALILSMQFAPQMAARQDEIRHQAKYASNISGLSAGQFNITDNGRRTVFFERWERDGERMRNVFYYGRDEQGIATIHTADTAHIHLERNAAYVVFESGRAYSGMPGRRDYRIIEYAAHGVRLKQHDKPLLTLRISSTPTAELINATESELIAEWHWRLAVPVACFLLGVLALPLSYSAPRKGRYSRIGIAVLIYIIYLNCLGVGRAWLERQEVSSMLGLWWVHLAMFLGIVVLILKQEQKAIFSMRLKSL